MRTNPPDPFSFSHHWHSCSNNARWAMELTRQQQEIARKDAEVAHLRRELLQANSSYEKRLREMRTNYEVRARLSYNEC